MSEYRDEECAGRRRQRRRVMTLVGTGLGLLALLAIYLVVVAVPHVRCGSPFDGIRMQDGECVGVTDGSFVFHPRLAEVQADIKRENDLAAAKAEDEGTPIVKIGLLMPITATEGSALNIDTVRSSLQGAYVALHRANQHRDLGAPQPLFQLLLANEGSVQQGWEFAVSQLAGMTDDDIPLVAVAGQAIGTENTRRAAEQLSAQRIPVITGSSTADDLDNAHVENLLRAAPSNTDFVTAMRSYLDNREQNDLESGILVYDDVAHDTFVSTLREAYVTQLGDYIQFSDQPFPGQSLERSGLDVFHPVTQNICQVEPDMVFFAGRAPDAEIFIEALSQRVCRDRSIAVLFAEIGLYPRDPEVERLLEAGNITLLHATGSDPGWARGEKAAPEGFADFYEHYQVLVDRDPTTLDNGYAITYHDSLAIAITATRITRRYDASAPSAEEVTNSLLLLNSEHAVRGASGTLSFNRNRDGNPGGKFVPIVALPSSEEFAETETYVTPTE